MRIKTAAAMRLGTVAALAVSILTSALVHADGVFIACPSGRDGVATSVTSCEFADNVRRAYLEAKSRHQSQLGIDGLVVRYRCLLSSDVEAYWP
jgi:hypothetical protein